MYLIGIMTTGEKQSYDELSNISNSQLKKDLNNKDWIFKIVEMKETDLKEYRKLNAKCSIMDLFDREFDSVIHRMREMEITSIHLDEYIKKLESETKPI